MNEAEAAQAACATGLKIREPNPYILYYDSRALPWLAQALADRAELLALLRRFEWSGGNSNVAVCQCCG